MAWFCADWFIFSLVSYYYRGVKVELLRLLFYCSAGVVRRMRSSTHTHSYTREKSMETRYTFKPVEITHTAPALHRLNWMFPFSPFLVFNTHTHTAHFSHHIFSSKLSSRLIYPNTSSPLLYSFLLSIFFLFPALFSPHISSFPPALFISHHFTFPLFMSSCDFISPLLYPFLPHSTLFRISSAHFFPLFLLLSSGLLSPSSFPASFQSFLQSESLEFFCTHCHKQISRLEDLSTRLQLLEMNR